MKSIVLCLTAHNPFLLQKDFNFFSIGGGEHYFDHEATRQVLNELCDECYIPANKTLAAALEQYKGQFRVNIDISSSLLEQLEVYRPDVLESFAQLFAHESSVELLASTGRHSVASLGYDSEFIDQILEHSSRLKSMFERRPTVFMNTDLLYSDYISDLLAANRAKIKNKIKI